MVAYTEIKEFPLLKRGKVRDIYDLEDKLLIISTDRISCFDVVLPTCIPLKGKVLNQISIFWFKFTERIIPNHFISEKLEDYPEELKRYKDVLIGRSMLVKKAKTIPVECVVRGYLSGSAWKEYQSKQSVCGIKLPKGLKEFEKLPQAIFTPSTKEDTGHDMNVSEDYVEKKLGKKIFKEIKEISLKIYKKAASYAQRCGIIIADTKFEFGIYNQKLILIDELLSPDSSRFWPKDQYKPGSPQVSFDKQFVRDYLESIRWDKNPPAPTLPQEIILKTKEKYLLVYRLLTGKDIEDEDT
ncbi:MAG: phosphoribosylaminoimidazolesuccinocarboxamide synthase [Candidatus Omnitrophica bacterium]|nr:phosphoribosylaminoimidazolesuccinocarboxamide synthase [Candidatus Omnitrophota bacterium]MCM8800027.1 phosphoribosylaminoimidazolesuccinocarboxamide synthase [Candidatus Omnitrophota bacterium]